MADTIAYTSVSILYMMLRFVGSSVNTWWWHAGD